MRSEDTFDDPGLRELRRAPTCVLSFNRPAYLEESVRSILRAYQEFKMEGPIVLFQDGARSDQRAIGNELKNIERCTSVFRKIIPHGVVFSSTLNLGIARNFYRAEKWVFFELKHDVGLFFEDDMIVSTRYFEALAQLNILARRHPRIGMFSAYGIDARMDADEQHRRRRTVGEMHHNWGFGLRRDAWIARESYTAEYMALLADIDYRHRSAFQVASWYNRMGWPPLATNQDLAKSVVLNHIGYVRLTTAVVLGKYIGVEGEHFSQQEYEQLGFDKTVLYTEVYPEEDCKFTISENEIETIWRAQRRALLQSSLQHNELLRDKQFSSAVQMFIRFGFQKLLARRGATVVEAVSGIYDDMWCGPNSSLVIRHDLPVRRILIEGQLAPHLPKGSKLSVLLNLQCMATIVAVNEEQVEVIDLSINPNQDGLGKFLSFSSDTVIDPFSVGYGTDRRPLLLHLRRITIICDDMTVDFVGSEMLSAELTQQGQPNQGLA